MGWATILLPILSMAQTNNQFVQKSDERFIALPKTATGVLYNRVAPLANLIKISKEKPLSAHYFQQAWFELYNASYNTNKLFSSGRLDSLATYYSMHNTLLLASRL